LTPDNSWSIEKDMRNATTATATKARPRYRITYTEGVGDYETFTAVISGNDAEHAEERFLDQMEREGGIEGVRIKTTIRLRD